LLGHCGCASFSRFITMQRATIIQFSSSDIALERTLMAATGELIRMMNYVDDIAATLRRINASLYLITGEEKKRLAEYMRASDPNFLTVVEQLDKGE
jgi:hypothetical protein